MKSEHRHELKTNELAEWLFNFPKWAKSNARNIIYVGTVIAVVLTAYFYWIYQKNVVAVNRQIKLFDYINEIKMVKPNIVRSQAQGVDISYELINIARKLKAITGEIKKDTMSALALIKRGDALRTELHYRPETLTSQELNTQISKARESYTEALSLSADNPTLLGLAKFGLGICEEELGNFEQAQAIYREIIEQPELQVTTAFAQARLRLAIMKDFKERIVFRAAPKPAIPVTPIVEMKPSLPEVNTP